MTHPEKTDLEQQHTPVNELVNSFSKREKLVQAQTKEAIMDLYKNIVDSKENNENKDIVTLENELIGNLDEAMKQISERWISKNRQESWSDYGTIYLYAKLNNCEINGKKVNRNLPGMGSEENLKIILDEYTYGETLTTLKNLSGAKNIWESMENPTIRKKIWQLPDKVLTTTRNKTEESKKLTERIDTEIENHKKNRENITEWKLAEVLLVARMRNRPKRMLTLPKLLGMLDDPEIQESKEAFNGEKNMKEWTYDETKSVFTFIFGEGSSTEKFLEKANGNEKPLLCAITTAYHEKGFRFRTDNATDRSTSNLWYFGTFQLSKLYHSDIIHKINKTKLPSGQKELSARMSYLEKIGTNKTRDKMKNAPKEDLGSVIADIQLQNSKDGQWYSMRQKVNNMINIGENPHKLFAWDKEKMNLSFFIQFPERAKKWESMSQNWAYKYNNSNQIEQREKQKNISDPIDELTYTEPEKV